MRQFQQYRAEYQFGKRAFEMYFWAQDKFSAEDHAHFVGRQEGARAESVKRVGRNDYRSEDQMGRFAAA